MGELTWRDKGLMWKDETYDALYLTDHLETPYEIEAYGREKGLLYGFLKVWAGIEKELNLDEL